MTHLKRIRMATQLKSITLRNGIQYPLDYRCVHIELDKKKPIPKKLHGVIYQQGSFYGTVGDYCHYISHEELFELEEKGMIKLS